MKLRLDPFSPNGVSLENTTVYTGGGSSSGGTSSPLTTKGDVYTYSTTNDRLPVGGNGTVLSADSTQATGLKWISAGGTGTVTSVASADGSITVTNPTTTPDLSVIKATTGFTVSGGNLTVDTSTLYVDSTNHRVGIGTTSPGVVLDIIGTSIRQSNTTTDATNKAFRFQTRNFTNAQNDFLLVFGQSKTTTNTLLLGGGQTGSVAASTISLFTGSGNNTDTGTSRLTVDASGNVLISSLTGSKVVFTDSSKNLTSTGIGTSSQFIKGDGSLDSTTYAANLTGPITSVGNATSIASQTGTGTKFVVDASPALTGTPTAPTATPANNSTQIATTAYVDNAVLGQNFKEAVGAATTANLVGTYANGASGVGATFTYTATGIDTIDGVALTLNMRVLLKNQTSDFQNGIYTVTTAGAIGVAGILTRALDADQTNEWKTGDSTFVTAGTTLSTTTWAYTGIDSPTMGTTSLTFVQTAGQGSFTAGTGIAITGNSIAIDTSVTVDKTTVQTLSSKTLTTPVINGTITGTGQATAATASTITMRDSNANTAMNNLVEAFTTTATAAGTTTMTIASTKTQVWTGSSAQTVKLPTTSVLQGQQYLIINQSSGLVTVQSSGANTITILAAGTSALFTAVVATPTTAANWDSQYASVKAASGKVGTFSNNLTLAGTDGTTQTFQASDTIVGRGTTDTLTNKTLTAPVIANAGYIADANGNEQIIFNTTASAVNEFTFANAATLTAPTITMSGGDTNVSLNIVPKGSGSVLINNILVATASNSLTLTNKTITDPVINQFGTGSGLGAAYTSWTPSYTASGGTPTTVTTNKAVYKQFGKMIAARLDFTVTTVGTATGHIEFTLPVTALDTSNAGSGIEIAVTGNAGAVWTKTTAKGALTIYNGTTGWVVNYRWLVNLVYEAA